MPAPTCPNCGERLERIAEAIESPPWACWEPCARAWWDAELTKAARDAWDPRARAFTLDEAGEMIRLAAEVEHETAFPRVSRVPVGDQGQRPDLGRGR